MIKNCKYCNGNRFTKNGLMNGKQRYKCRNCKRSITENDRRRSLRQYDDKIRHLAIAMRLNSNGFRNIARVLSVFLDRKIPYQTIVKWVNYEYKKLQKIEQPMDDKTIEILELDELYTYFKKNPKTVNSTKTQHTSEYGLLWTATEIKLVHLL